MGICKPGNGFLVCFLLLLQSTRDQVIYKEWNFIWLMVLLTSKSIFKVMASDEGLTLHHTMAKAETEQCASWGPSLSLCKATNATVRVLASDLI